LPSLERIPLGRAPALLDLTGGRAAASRLPRGGESEGRRRLERWLQAGLEHYDERRDDLSVDGTSGLSPYLHLGCVSPLEVVERALPREGGEAFVRQLCWRDFHHQLLAGDPRTSTRDLRPRGDRWRDDPEGLAAWKAGRTGYPLVDAGMRQLSAEGTMHNRARLVTASFLAKHLYLDWRLGAAHFAEHLVDGDVASNTGNWQWVAGTGADTRPNRVFNPTRQARRFDSEGEYVRRWVPELAGLPGAAAHEPWLLASPPTGYPPPMVAHEVAVRRFLAARRGA
jgi:deoxyribodipyrimidine photo-lyase